MGFEYEIFLDYGFVPGFDVLQKLDERRVLVSTLNEHLRVSVKTASGLLRLQRYEARIRATKCSSFCRGIAPEDVLAWCSVLQRCACLLG